MNDPPREEVMDQISVCPGVDSSKRPRLAGELIKPSSALCQYVGAGHAPAACAQLDSRGHHPVRSASWRAESLTFSALSGGDASTAIGVTEVSACIILCIGPGGRSTHTAGPHWEGAAAAFAKTQGTYVAAHYKPSFLQLPAKPLPLQNAVTSHSTFQPCWIYTHTHTKEGIFTNTKKTNMYLTLWYTG